jgi:coronin-1B/1C/6
MTFLPHHQKICPLKSGTLKVDLKVTRVMLFKLLLVMERKLVLSDGIQPDNVIASAGADYVVKVWDVETGVGKYKSDGPTNLIQSLDWNYDASLLVTNSKDKNLRIIDPRQQSVVSTVESHVGVKGGRALWLGKHPLVCSVGFGSGASREYKVYDSRKMESALATTSLESAAGVIMPFYDEDADLLFMAGKGDGAIKFYEVNPEEEPKSIVSHLGQFTSNNATSAACSLPRRSCNVQEVEIIRLYKITKGTVVPLHFQVPRRSDLFADDVYIPARGDEPALDKDAWFGGENATPKLVSLEGGFVAKEKAVGNFTQSSQKDDSDTPKDLKGAYDALKKKVAELEAEIEKRDAKIAELESK